jgi:hypothetical protein
MRVRWVEFSEVCVLGRCLRTWLDGLLGLDNGTPGEGRRS